MTAERPEPADRIDADAVVDLAMDLLAIDTANPPGETVEIVDFVESRLAAFPVETERIVADPAKPNLLVTLPGRGDRTLLYNGHFDTVPYDAEAWTYDPLGERVDGRVYGRGATDMKGPLAGMIATIEAWAVADKQPPVNLRFAFVSDEEVGGEAGLSTLVKRGTLAADGCVIGEPTCETARHSVTVADRGSIWLTLSATGKAAHGSRPPLGENAIDRLYGAITTFRDRFGDRRMTLDQSIDPILEETVEYYAPSMGEAVARELFETPSINLGTIKGGEAINTVPQHAEAEIDVRVTAGVHTPDLLEDVRACIAGCEGVTITDVAWSVGTAEPIDSPLVEAVAGAAEDVIRERVYRRSATGGGDAKTLRNAGIPTVEFALGTDTVHAVDEYLTVGALVDNARIYTSLPNRFAAIEA